jgi:amino acid adenylation domain-containing protein/thioester reductase-like protein
MSSIIKAPSSHLLDGIYKYQSLGDALRERVRQTPERTAYVYLTNGEGEESTLTYRQLDERARIIAAQLQSRPCKGERILLMYPQGLDFVTAFFGCIYAGAIAVLVYPPANKRMAERMQRIVTDCGVSRVLTSSEVAARLQKLLTEKDAAAGPRSGAAGADLSALRNLHWSLTDQPSGVSAADFRDEQIVHGDLAFLQYTSGSTGTPKGVMVSHGNIIANEEAIRSIFRHSSESLTVSWLPLLHDMGLIGSTLQPLYVGYPLVFMSPLHFMQRPVRWLQAITKYRATSSGGPNFAFDLCASKISEADKATLDLSSWEVAFNGAEPVRQDTMRRFYEAFAGVGLRPHAQIGVYGLAEATLLITGAEPGKPAGATDAGCMSSGDIAPFHDVKIVDPISLEVQAPGLEGEVWAAGASIAQGYWGRPDATRETFQAKLAGSDTPYLRTGDMGYLQDGQLFVTGRIKDLIIVNGRNYHAEDMEWSIEEIDGLKAGHSAAFMLDDADASSLTIVASVDAEVKAEPLALVDKIVARVYEDYQLQVRRVVLIRSKSLPKTTSGKTQRKLTRDRYLKQELSVVLDQEVGACFGGATREQDGASASRPKNAEELELTRVWSEVLGVDAEKIGVDDNFFSLGGHSVLMLELGERLGVSLELLFKYPTIRSFLSRSGEYQFPDVAPDLHLAPAALDPTLQGDTHVALVTGGTGLFGFHLVRSLLRRTNQHLICLVRGADAADIRRKFLATASYYEAAEDLDMSRITLLKGDFSEERLGLSDDVYADLSARVDRIYHIASHVNNWLPYEGIREINVFGTQRLLSLARTGRKKQFHYASTSTFAPKAEDASVFREFDDIDPAAINKYNGYDISKFVSESLCKMARKEGTECSIYRMVWVGGNSETGLSKLNDGFNIMLRILLKLGVFPAGNYLHDVVPVNLMADAMASVASKSRNTDFNLTSQSNESVDMLKIVAMLRNLGYSLQEVSREEFVSRLRDFPDESWDEHCRSYRQLVIRLFDEEVKPESFYDSSNLRSFLDADVRESLEKKFVENWFKRAVGFLVRQHALPAPSGRGYRDDLALIAGWNETSRDYDATQCVHQLFEARARMTPYAPALSLDGERLTYQELDDRANRLAALLVHSGVEQGAFVGVCLERGFDLYAALLGVMKAGAAYVPLDPTYPVEVLEHMVQDSAATLVLTSLLTESQVARTASRRLVIDGPEALAQRAAFVEPEQLFEARSPRSSDLAYVIYTSGTTGKPKGVMIEHRSVVNHNLSMIGEFGLEPRDNLLQFATMNFDSFVEEVFPILAAGATLTIIREEDRKDVARLKAVIAQNGVNKLKFPTAFWHSIADVSLDGLGVQMVGIGGEEADIGRFRTWLLTNPSIPVVNTYGPTETAITVTVCHLQPEHATAERLPIGHPLRNTQIHILDDQLRPVPIGVPGDLYIAGHGVGRGYLNRQPETARAFLENPLAPGERLYKSGDVASWLPNGDIQYLGRSDNQVKVRGYRIELGAIESVLNEHASIGSAAVVLTRQGQEKRIVAYVTGRADSAVEPSKLREYIKQRLPAYMTPDCIVPIAKLPMNPNGKVDRGVLEQREIALDLDEQRHVAPRTQLELDLVEVWRDTLGVRRVGIDDDFLDLGGHSLLAIGLLQNIQQRLGLKLSVQDLYSNLTVRQLAEHLARPLEAASGERSSLVTFPENPAAACELQPAQQLFMVHGVGGNLASFYPLVRNLKQQMAERHGRRLPIHGIQVNAVEGSGFNCSEEMVQAYVAHVRELQPEGPYALCGWSYGVSIAFLMAQELIKQGQRISSFIALDAEAPMAHADFVAFLEERRIASALELYDDENLALALERFGHKFGFAQARAVNLKALLCRFLGYPDGLPTKQRDVYNLVAVSNMYNARGFLPERLRVERALLLRAVESRFEAFAEGWQNALDSREHSSHVLDGDHWSIMSARATAQRVIDFLTHVDSDAPRLQRGSFLERLRADAE